jgi:prepilin-type N-terminal cleavage/methylation domain-containing protein
MLLSPRPPTPRRGLSLLEVLVALAIFLLSFVAIGRLVTLASDHAVDIQQQSEATRLAQSKINEVLCGSLGLQSAEGDEDEWHWSIDAEQNTSVNGLWTVTATVTRPGSEPEVSATVSQMVFDPTMRGSVFDTVTVTGSTDAAPTNGSTGSGQGTGGQTGGGAMAGGAAGGAARGGGAAKGGGMGGAGGNNNNTRPTPGNNNNRPTPGNNNNRPTPGNNNNNNRPTPGGPKP